MGHLAHIVREWVLWIARVAMVSMTNVNVFTPDSIRRAGFLVLLAMDWEKCILSVRHAMDQAVYNWGGASPVGINLRMPFCSWLHLCSLIENCGCTIDNG